MNTIINIQNLKKNFDEVEAVKGISLEIRKGEMFGLVGPDGAGKTTTIRMLCGLINPNEGNIKILDKNLSDSKKDIQKSIGYLSQKFSLYGELTVDENIEFFAEIHNVFDYEERRTQLLDFTRLTNFRDRLTEKLSGGMKQKLALACSLIHKPEILFLDEPTTGVDPVSRRDFWKILAELQKGGLTILMTTPYLDEAERCNRVAMMDKGKIIACNPPSVIKKEINTAVLEIVCNPSRKAYSLIKRLEKYEVHLFGDRISLMIKSEDEFNQNIKKILIDNSVEITGIRKVTPSLENVFMHLINEAN